MIIVNYVIEKILEGVRQFDRISNEEARLILQTTMENVFIDRQFLPDIMMNDNIRPAIRNVLDREILGNKLFFGCFDNKLLFKNVDINEEDFFKNSEVLSSNFSNFEEGAFQEIRWRNRNVEKGNIKRVRSPYTPDNYKSFYSLAGDNMVVGRVYYYTFIGSLINLGYYSIAVMAKNFSSPDVWGKTPKGRGIYYVIQSLLNQALPIIRDSDKILRDKKLNIVFHFPGGSAIIPNPRKIGSYSWIPNRWPIEVGVWKFDAKSLMEPDCFRESKKVYSIIAGFPFIVYLRTENK